MDVLCAFPPWYCRRFESGVVFVTVSLTSPEYHTASNTAPTSLSSSEHRATVSYSKPSPTMSQLDLPLPISPPWKHQLLSQINYHNCINGEITPQDLAPTSCATTGAGAGEDFYYQHNSTSPHFAGYNGTSVAKHIGSTIIPVLPDQSGTQPTTNTCEATASTTYP